LEKSGSDIFLSHTHYDRLVDLKKLEFIFSAIHKYALLHDKDPDELTILEVGCGDGGITVPMGSLGCHVKAFDINEKAVQSAETKIDEKEFQNVVVCVDDGYTFDDGKYYDVVIASEILEHVQDPFRFVANISKRMRMGSYFVITVPNGFGPWELRNRIFMNKLYRSNVIRRMLGKKLYDETSGGEHLQFYRLSQLLCMLSRFSFSLVDFSNSDSVFAALWSPLNKPNRLLEKIDITLADLLPYWCASGWYLSFMKE
jgi:2-polyprenyl-3-methyl-5-hydroxy-6-metoxy-1,4-benzoquinol methylase